MTIFNFQFSIFKNNHGQALVTLLFFVIISLTITAGAVAVLFSSALDATRLQQGSIAYDIAQSGAENAILRLLRDPAYTGETLTVGNGSTIIQVVNNGGGSYTITSKATVGNLVRQMQVDITYTDNVLTVNSQKQIF